MTRRLLIQQLLKPRRHATNDHAPTDMQAINDAVTELNRFSDEMNLYIRTLDAGRTMDFSRWKRIVALKKRADGAWDQLTRG